MKCKVLDIDYTTDIPDELLNSLLAQDETEVSVCRPLMVKEGLALICLFRVGDTNAHRLRTYLADQIGDPDLYETWVSAEQDDLPYFADISKEFSANGLQKIADNSAAN